MQKFCCIYNIERPIMEVIKMTKEERKEFNDEIRLILQQEYLELYGEEVCREICENEKEISHETFKRIFSDYSFINNS